MEESLKRVKKKLPQISLLFCIKHIAGNNFEKDFDPQWTPPSKFPFRVTPSIKIGKI
jgi:hypothetical protein